MSVSLKTALKLSRNLLPWATTRGQTADIHFSLPHMKIIVFLFKKDVVLHGNHIYLYFLTGFSAPGWLVEWCLLTAPV